MEGKGNQTNLYKFIVLNSTAIIFNLANNHFPGP